MQYTVCGISNGACAYCYAKLATPVDNRDVAFYNESISEGERKPSYQYKDVPIPSPGEGDLLIKVRKVRAER